MIHQDQDQLNGDREAMLGDFPDPWITRTQCILGRVYWYNECIKCLKWEIQKKDVKNNIKTTKKKTPQDLGKEVKSLEDFCCNEILGLVLRIPKWTHFAVKDSVWK